MREPTEAQVKEFWEWCGFKFSHTASLRNFFYGKTDKTSDFWLYPDGSCQGLPPIDPNSLFKWAVPKVGELSTITLIPTIAGNWGCKIHYDNWNKSKSVIDKDPALALFWALDKVRK